MLAATPRTRQRERAGRPADGPGAAERDISGAAGHFPRRTSHERMEHRAATRGSRTMKRARFVRQASSFCSPWLPRHGLERRRRSRSRRTPPGAPTTRTRPQVRRTCWGQPSACASRAPGAQLRVDPESLSGRHLDLGSGDHPQHTRGAGRVLLLEELLPRGLRHGDPVRCGRRHGRGVGQRDEPGLRAAASTNVGLAAHAQSNLMHFTLTPLLVPGWNTLTVRGQNGAGSFAGCTNCTYAQHPAGVVFGGAIDVEAARYCTAGTAPADARRPCHPWASRARRRPPAST